ncbi:hypothetical protein GUITHDRAFT_139465 [Guillardia theta CCMP2712]|uniref:rRNA biogenesis protein RRP36 n=1 Tax=Guillardia theta (strain CCMP2712) TaxID=905079 RepID=L1J8H9_GUITC|nr:hypothetical protein GUITHDRAFT_139465 [Guillardia theta CCMP2712]EKX44848.1 hypothetical protein GUITHDRAFT_139465 [Guillardia theta CCMP2712]|eukprot:XP_005831828.1 hypothetical protein GUITHDRAFT_139465 [Guillardia theta CCMP2712]
MGIAKKKSEQSTGAPKSMSDSMKKGPNHGKLLKKLETSKAHKSRSESKEEESDSEDDKISDQPSELDNESDEDSSMVSGDSDEEDEENSSEDEAEKARRELSDVPFEVLQELQKDGKVDSKFNKDTSRKMTIRQKIKQVKGAPVEATSKKPVSRFQKTYSFVSDQRKSEMKSLKQKIAKTKNEEMRNQLEEELRELQRSQQKEDATNANREKLKERRRTERDAVAKGKKPFYLKKSDQRILELAKKYEVNFGLRCDSD